MPSISTHPTQMSDTLPPNSQSFVGNVSPTVTLSNTHGPDHRGHPAASCASAGGWDRDSLPDVLKAVRLSEFEALILVAAHNGICVGDPINAPTTMRFAAMVLANEVDEYLADVSLCVDGDAAKDRRGTDDVAAPETPDATLAVAPVRMDPIEGSHAAGELIGASVTRGQRTLIVAKLAAYSFDARLAIVDAIARYWNRDAVRIDACSGLADRLRQVGLLA